MGCLISKQFWKIINKISSKNHKKKEKKLVMNNCVIIWGTTFFLVTFSFQVVFIEDGDEYLYTELQESHM
tara:strand:- start:119 stop:328 length:210 start_codon:yes stop_codon:yes gene_type:complete